MKAIIFKKEILQRAKKILKNQSFYQGKLIFKKSLPTNFKRVEFQEEKLLEILEFLKKKYHLKLDFYQGLFYFISELAINIPEHAQAKRAFLKVFEIKVKDKNFLEILIRDEGIGIKKSFLQNKIFVQDDLEALREALRGLSAKDKKERGFGLRTSENTVVRAFEGNFLLFSGRAIFWNQRNKESFFSSKFGLQGTAINCLIPLKEKKINIYRFIE